MNDQTGDKKKDAVEDTSTKDASLDVAHVDRPLTRAAILDADDIDIKRVDVPEWGGHVFVKTMGGVERDAIEERIVATPGKERNLSNLRAIITAASVCTDKGALLFSEEDIVALGAKSALALDRVFDVSKRMSGLTNDDVEELVGN